MKRKTKLWFVWTLIVALSFLIVSFRNENALKPGQFPYRQAGLTDEQAVAHLLSRFTYGVKTGQIKDVMKISPERWFALQLEGGLPDDTLDELLRQYPALKLNNSEVVNTYPRNARILQMAVKDGVIKKDSLSAAGKSEYRALLATYMKANGYQPQKELVRQFINQKIWRAAYSNNQLHEVLTEFWFNHFNVSFSKNQCAPFIPAYERDVIRPMTTAKFGDLLLATAQSPAMLYYLDNFSSSSADTNRNSGKKPGMQPMPLRKRTKGINENYAREVMELHTLGVDGGYTQQDVTEAARILTGWTVYPLDSNAYGKMVQKRLERMDRNQAKGYVRIGDFLFTPNRHDAGEKQVLGQKFGKVEGYQEGVKLLAMLANHPSTARFICKKLAVRFVSDNPPQSLLDKMVHTFQTKDGSIAAVLTTMVYAPEFWDKKAVGVKTKSPFELVISAVRGLDAEIRQPYQLYTWASKIGQNIYHYQAPTGFPDYAGYWINTGALLNRINFGLAIESGKIPGVKANPAGISVGSPEFQRR
ncbi:DUF1800 domain-containing protein [Dyadobacter arcticus]|uniref:Uncharacterized protein (DUF1800 family) n=1 Tax=Dyadobacter arcticus TaxID=1078754 RepID=A0ABX0UPX9_9BACT|nr:DUF1800 domain-containing protein [Dyadobacter arcticus]NIJ55052.1 uncharacterized protein (DUF1800 family) [Dyadobacter arcticus]